MSRRTFIHRFPDGLIASLTLTAERGRLAEMRCAWSRELTPRVVKSLLPEYRRWRDESLSTFATEHGLRGVLVIET